MQKLETTRTTAVIVFIGMMLFSTPPSYSKDATGIATAKVVSSQNLAIVDFNDSTVCVDDNCTEQPNKTRTICQGNDDVFRDCLKREVERFESVEARQMNIVSR